ncbi:hypothetical protein [[Clostridium] fimetarium]|uniref:Uncharacterized protein n=1 Tax=[Clostridium] fimetarium TaxID=99656 RepID=A0A1I0MRY4_9FIRM|nr:hypothetical protein [[Clostridium] fimetarium]SEV91459.1 hypothetical protein SAMN05421659_102100 [[Clostridium] fimetarium]
MKYSTKTVQNIVRKTVRKQYAKQYENSTKYRTKKVRKQYKIQYAKQYKKQYGKKVEQVEKVKNRHKTNREKIPESNFSRLHLRVGNEVAHNLERKNRKFNG